MSSLALLHQAFKLQSLLFEDVQSWWNGFRFFVCDSLFFYTFSKIFALFSLKIFKIKYLYTYLQAYLRVCVYTPLLMCHGIYVEDRGQREEDGSVSFHPVHPQHQAHIIRLHRYAFVCQAPSLSTFATLCHPFLSLCLFLAIEFLFFSFLLICILYYPLHLYLEFILLTLKKNTF